MDQARLVVWTGDSGRRRSNPDAMKIDLYRSKASNEVLIGGSQVAVVGQGELAEEERWLGVLYRNWLGPFCSVPRMKLGSRIQ